MAFASMLQVRIDRQQERRCTQVKELPRGRYNTEYHKCPSLRFLRTSELKRKLNLTSSSFEAGRSVRSIWPSSSSTASQRSQTNHTTLSVWRSRTSTRERNHEGSGPVLLCHIRIPSISPSGRGTVNRKLSTLPCWNFLRAGSRSSNRRVCVCSNVPVSTIETSAVVPALLSKPVKTITS